MTIRIVFFRQRNLLTKAIGKTNSANKSRTVLIGTMVDECTSIVGPHFMAYPVFPASAFAFLPYLPELFSIRQPDTANTAILVRPLVVEHDQVVIGRAELHMGNPCVGNSLPEQKNTCHRVKHIEIRAKMLFLYAFVDIISRSLVQSASLCLGIKSQRSAINCGNAKPQAICADMTKCRHLPVCNLTQSFPDSVAIGLIDDVVLYVIDNAMDAVQSDTCLCQSL